MNVFRIKSVFKTLIRLAWDTQGENTPGYGSPVSHLVDMAMLYPTQYEATIERVASGQQVEFRLNGAGLKLYTRGDPRTHQRVKMRVGGDQARQYPGFVEEANNWLSSKGF